MDDYLCKPVTKKDLVEILNKHFSVKKVLPNLDLQENIVQHSLSEIISPETLKTFLAIESRGEKNFADEILQIYCENAENQISVLLDDFQKRDARSIARLAHHLKGSSANVGLEKLTELFDDLQDQADSENWTRIEDLIFESTENFEHIKQITFKRGHI
jgi:HPt (histidine-containing phosphotransfer) domain-containing protein